MEIGRVLIGILCIITIDAVIIKNDDVNDDIVNDKVKTVGIVNETEVTDLDEAFNGVYVECLLRLSYSCLQNKTLYYLKELNDLSEVSLIGGYVKFVKLNSSKHEKDEEYAPGKSTDELAYMIDKAIDRFFDNRVIKFSGLGREISLSNNVEQFVGRKKRKGGGGGGGGHGGDDGGKKKMMMMAMMCMKMKLMMMLPAMMGMMGMMSFKGMMFSMMSFMVSKMMLLMKILEKKGGAGGGLGGAAGDGGWPASAGGGGAWMPAGGQDYAGGGYDANGQWQSRSILEKEKVLKKPIVTYVDPIKKYKNIDERIEYYDVTRLNGVSNDAIPKLRSRRNLVGNFNNNDDISYRDYNNDSPELKIRRDVRRELLDKNIKYNSLSKIRIPRDINTDKSVTSDILHDYSETKGDIKMIRYSDALEYDTLRTKIAAKKDTKSKYRSRQKRSLMDDLQNAYIYWVNKILGIGNRRTSSTPKYKVVNGVKYIYYPFRKIRAPKDNRIKIVNDEVKIITADDFNKGEIMEGAVESRMNKKKFHKMKDTVNDTIDDNPWE